MDSVKVVFIRNAQDTWNKKNLFIGWTDPPLTRQGVIEARLAGKILKDAHFRFDEVHCSILRRATKTAWLCVQELEQEWLPVNLTWKLNEQHYGVAVGRNAKDLVHEYGRDVVELWHLGWHSKTMPMSAGHEHWPGKDKRYAAYGVTVPGSESLADVSKRAMAYWDEHISPKIKQGKSILIISHRNTIRGMIKHIDNISEEDIKAVQVPRSFPIVYTFDRLTGKPIKCKHAQTSDAIGPMQKLLSGYFLGDANDLEKALEREHRQLYDLSVSDDVEEHPEYLRALYDRWLNLMRATFTSAGSGHDSGPGSADETSKGREDAQTLSWSKDDKELGVSVEQSLAATSLRLSKKGITGTSDAKDSTTVTNK